MRLLFILLFSFTSFSQEEKIAVLGNYKQLCLNDSSIIQLDSLPDNLNSYSAIMIFSTAYNSLSQRDVDELIAFTEVGGSIYLGSDNWPLQSESNTITKAVYSKEVFGTYEVPNAEVDINQSGNLKLNELDSIPAGQTTVAFPLDYRLKVEAWVEDQPLISTGHINSGRIVIDGGYSRFYCENLTENGEKLLISIINYLLSKG